MTAEDNHAPDLLWKISQVQNKLLTLGFCVRGGISFGEILIYGDDPIRNIFGQTLVNAYTSESERAIYPRVIIDEGIVARITREFEAKKKQTADIFVLHDADGCSFVNQFARDVINTANATHRKKAFENKRLYSAKIKEGMKLANAKAKMKWHWLLSQHKKQFRNV